MHDSVADSGGRRLLPHLLLFVVFCFWFSLYTYPSILTPYLDELGSTLSFSGVIVGSYGFTQMLLRLPAGILSDKLHNRKAFVISGLFFSLLSALGFLLTRELRLILVFRALAGVAAAMWVQMSTLYISYYRDEDSWKATGRVNFANTFGTMFATLGGGFLANRYGWSHAFILSAVVAGLGLLASFFIHEEKVTGTREAVTLSGALLVGLEPLLLITSILALFSQLVTFATSQGFVPIVAKELGAGTDQIALMATLNALTRALASLLSGRIAMQKRISVGRLILWSFVLNGLLNILIPHVPNMPLLIALQMLSGFIYGMQMSLLMGLCIRNIRPAQRSTAMGFYQAIYGIGMVGGPILVGNLSDHFSLTVGFVMIGAVSILSGLLAGGRLHRIQTKTVHK